MKLFTFFALLSLSSCAAAPIPQRLRLADVGRSGGGLDFTRPIELELSPGDRLPIRLAFSDQLFTLSPAAQQLELIAKRRGFVRIEQGRITSSLTGDDFDLAPLAPGQFRLGLALTRTGSWVDLSVTTPRRKEP